MSSTDRHARAPAANAPRKSPSMLRATLAVAGKELLTSFRDRQTTLYMIVLPIALYPLLFFFMIQGALLVQGRREHTVVRLGLAADARAQIPPGLIDALANEPDPRVNAEPEPEEPHSVPPPPINRMQIEPAPEPLEEELARAWIDKHAPQGSLAKVGAEAGAERPDAVLFLRGEPEGARAVADDALDAQPGDAAQARARLYYDSTLSHSEIAKKRVEKRLPPLSDALRAQAARANGDDPLDMQPYLREEARNIAPKTDMGAYLLSFMLPMLLVIMTVMGAFFPAVDLTAGERERHTAETTLLLPIPRRAVYQGKILAVCTGAVLAGGLNLLALALSAGHLLHMLSSSSDIQINVPLKAFVTIAPLALLFAFFVSAILTAIASLARTFKEGQALLGPVQMIFIFPAMAGAVPGLELTPGVACVPVLNVVLAFRAMLKGEFLPIAFSLTAVSLIVFAALAVWVAVRTLSREALVVSERSATLKDFFRIWRSPENAR